MKNANYIETIVVCGPYGGCNLGGFFCETPFGGDCSTCPLCGAFDITHLAYTWPKELEPTQVEYINWLDTLYDSTDLQYLYDFCPKCLIMYDIGCTHAIRGCTDDIFNAHVVSKYKFRGFIYDGMPQFNSVQEWIDLANEIEILAMTCLNNGNHCVASLCPNNNVCDLNDSSNQDKIETSFKFPRGENVS